MTLIQSAPGGNTGKTNPFSASAATKSQAPAQASGGPLNPLNSPLNSDQEHAWQSTVLRTLGLG